MLPQMTLFGSLICIIGRGLICCDGLRSSDTADMVGGRRAN